MLGWGYAYNPACPQQVSLFSDSLLGSIKTDGRIVQGKNGVVGSCRAADRAAAMAGVLEQPLYIIFMFRLRLYSWLYRWLVSVAGVLLLASVAIFIYSVTPLEDNGVKYRNALIAEPASVDDLSWTPENTPDSFLQENEQIPQVWQEITATILPADASDLSNLEKSSLIARHMVENVRHRAAIKSNTLNAYRKITDKGLGYCADYAQVFNALAHAAGIPVREWGISFGGFGGGHGFNEIYDPELNKWVLIDSFESFYPVDHDNGKPLSVLEFMSLIRQDSDDEIRIVRIDDDHFRRHLKNDERAFFFYGRGDDQIFMYGGNSVLTYDSNTLVNVLGNVSRSLEQMAAIMLGIHPAIHILKTDTNSEELEDLRNKRLFFWGITGLIAILFCILLLLFIFRAHFLSRGASTRW